VMRILAVHIPLAPVWSLALGAVGFFLPARLVKAKAAAGRQELSDGVAEVAVLMSLAVSAGAGIDAAFRAALSGAPGRFASEVARARNAHPRDSLAKAIEDVAERLGLPEAASLAGAIGATEHGAAVGDALEELAWTMVEERRTEAIEAGVQARIRMLLVATGLMVPGYAALLIFPAIRLALAVEGPAGLAPHGQVRLEAVGGPAHPCPQPGRRIAQGFDDGVPSGRPRRGAEGGEVLGEARRAADEQHPRSRSEAEPAEDEEGDHRGPPQLRPCRPRPRRAMAQ